MNSGIWQSLSIRLFRLVLVGYVFFALLFAALQMAIGYRHATEKLELDLKTTSDTFTPAISEALWAIDRQLLGALATGMLQSPSISTVIIEDQAGKLLLAVPPNSRSSPDTLDADRIYSHEIVLERQTNRGLQVIGRLILVSETSMVWDKLRESALLIIVNAVVGMGVLWGVFMFVIRRGLQDPLAKLEEIVLKLELSAEAASPLRIEYTRNDEIGRLIKAMQKMHLRLAAAHGEIHSAKDSLEVQLKEQSEKLQRTHRTLMVSEISKSRAAERQRLIADMHDGFGTQLTSARIRMEQGKLSQEEAVEILRECMADLYLVVDVLNGDNGSLEQALIDFRFRVERRLAMSPMSIKWTIDVAGLIPLEQRIILQVLRIVQEALNNAVKHSKAAHISIEARLERNKVVIEIADDGVGIDVKIATGKGILNMERRAREIGASLEFPARRNGSVVSLCLVLSKKAANHEALTQNDLL